jgi:hypothetical protein
LVPSFYINDPSPKQGLTDPTNTYDFCTNDYWVPCVANTEAFRLTDPGCDSDCSSA